MRFDKNHGFEHEFEATPGYERGMTSAASGVARHVRAAAEPSRHTGRFVRSISSPGPVVTTDDFAWHLIEFGSVNNSPYAPFRKGIRAAGLRFDNARRPT